MPLPSYARATTSSTQKASLVPSNIKELGDIQTDTIRKPKSPTTSRASLPLRNSRAPEPNCAKAPSVKPSRRSSTPTTKPAPPQPKEREKHTPRKLKRPSTLTPKVRRTQAYKNDLHPITPLNPSKPCPLSSLPSELRTQIYTHLFSTRSLQDPSNCRYAATPHREQSARYLFPSILHVSRAIRIEAAYTFYSSTPFLWRIPNLNFARVRAWLDVLPAGHRALLSRNRGLTLDVVPFVQRLYTYPPKDYLLDDYVEAHWKACMPFGYLYTVPVAHRQQFIIFSRLAAWFLQPFGHSSSASSSMGQRYSIDWIYKFDAHRRRDYDVYPTIADGLLPFLKEDLGVVKMRAVQKAWVSNRREAEMGREARRFLDALDACFSDVDGTESRQQVSIKDWEEEMKGLRDFLGRW
ncbi:hypothetical protein P153DRAFT_396897 [Dothidotthia symphoricarpi CBS 119687]|uniref:F-box domain-containing protein n=1 Tax=Dothidotthia symphoricarpi CBS 119687 TaxID=1392245 RepID=A0A6A6ACL2_9PLEO|nr:uncharacterized protein P153DRAFT_396897 [Dothidotthia symphoricarpi CBS 119687]KAF2129642.1 hypothetical protein P153DRAFT_396897 [Dothidotthia symphoricarpi CBS 119687]